MDRIVRLHRDPHRETEKLLPWYVTGAIDPADRDAVESHLQDCEACRAELRLERRLGSEVAKLPWEAISGWAEFRAQLDPSSPQPRRTLGKRFAAWRGIAPSADVGWLIAAQAAFLLIAVPLMLPREKPPAYHVLGAAPASALGNVIVILRPDTAESRMRQILDDEQARLVDGPTAAGGYVLHIPPAQRASALARLRHRPDIVLAEPIDAVPPS